MTFISLSLALSGGSSGELIANRYFCSYELLKKRLAPEGTAASPVSILTAGGLAGICMWSIAIPADTIKVHNPNKTFASYAVLIPRCIQQSRLQSAPKGTYKGFIDCATQIMAKNGPKGLFSGFSAAMARAFVRPVLFSRTRPCN